MGYVENKRRYGAIRKGQVWEKLDSGRTMVIEGRKPRGYWHVMFFPLSGRPNHSIKERDIYSYYKKIQ